MGLFDKSINLTKEDNEKINSLLPQDLKRTQLGANDIIDGNLNSNYIYFCHKSEEDLMKLNKKISKLNKKRASSIASKILVFNTEIYDAKPLGMVDIGVVERFGATSTGNRFENDFIGYAIESSFDNVWAKNNAQFSAVQNAKLQLLLKAKDIYPECNMLFKFEIDFREIGTSGNVFIYVRGTACLGENKNIKKVIDERNDDIILTNEKISELKVKLQFLGENRKKIPSNRKELLSYLNR